MILGKQEESVLHDVQDEEGLKKMLPKICLSPRPREKKSDPAPRKHSPPLPYTQRLKQEMLNKEFVNFIEKFKQLHINIPFVDVLNQMPSNAKFKKEILMHKRKIVDDDEPMVLSTRFIAILRSKLPTKLKDPWSITIP